MIARISAVCLVACVFAGCTTRPESADTDSSTATLAAPDYSAEHDANVRVGQVTKVEPGENADWVLLDAGSERNVRSGMKITVRRQGKVIASLVVAETTAHAAAALILDLTPNQTVRSGDSAHITTN